MVCYNPHITGFSTFIPYIQEIIPKKNPYNWVVGSYNPLGFFFIAQVLLAVASHAMPCQPGGLW